MLAALFERSMGLDDAWEVSGTWSGEVEGVSTSLAPGSPGGADARSPVRGATSPVAHAGVARATGAISTFGETLLRACQRESISHALFRNDALGSARPWPIIFFFYVRPSWI